MRQGDSHRFRKHMPVTALTALLCAMILGLAGILYEVIHATMMTIFAASLVTSTASMENDAAGQNTPALSGNWTISSTALQGETASQQAPTLRFNRAVDPNAILTAQSAAQTLASIDQNSLASTAAATNVEISGDMNLLAGPLSDAYIRPELIIPDPSLSPLVNGSGITQDANGLIYHVLPDDDNMVTFTFAGDVLLDPYYAAGVAVRTNGMAGCFDQGLLNVMTSSDIFMLNNEFPFTNYAGKNDKKYTFAADPADAIRLSEIGTDIVSLANNHIFDRNEQGLLDTLTTLRSIGMPYVGAGQNLAEASRPWLYETTNGMKIAILNSTCIERYPNPNTRGATDTLSGVFRSYDPTLLYQKIAEARTYADFVIVYEHWGTEKEALPDANQRELAAGMANAGADLIIGDHPHCLETIEYVNGVPVIYSLGNYLFNSNTRQTALIMATLQPSTKKLAALQFIPVSCDAGCRESLATGQTYTQILQYQRSISPNITIADNGLIMPR